MGDDQDQSGDPAEAFEALRAEILLMRRDIAQLSAYRSDVPQPKDYDETLGRIMKIVSVSFQKVDAIVGSPALAMTPEHMAARIAAASITARQEDQRSITMARTALEEGVRQLSNRVGSARKGDKQNRWLAWVAIGGALFGMVLWATVAGVVARAAPVSWQWPEKMAARSLGLSMWEGGQRMMRVASPNVFAAIATSYSIVTANREALEACRKRANKVRERVLCTVNVEGDKMRR